MVSNLLSLMAGDSPCDHGLCWICWGMNFKRCFSGNDGKNAGHWALQIQQLPSLTDHQHDQIKSKCAVIYLFPPGFVATNRAHLSSRRRQWRRGNIADASGMWIECSVCISTLQTWCCCGAQRVVQDVPFVWLLWSTYILRGASLCCGDEQCWPPFREIFIDFLLLPVWATGRLTPQVVNTVRGKQLLTRNSIRQIGKFRKWWSNMGATQGTLWMHRIGWEEKSQIFSHHLTRFSVQFSNQHLTSPHHCFLSAWRCSPGTSAGNWKPLETVGDPKISAMKTSRYYKHSQADFTVQFGTNGWPIDINLRYFQV